MRHLGTKTCGTGSIKTRNMKTGTLLCRFFGHNFIGKKLVYDPHYLKLVDLGLAGVMTAMDYHHETYLSDYCVRCGIKRI